MKAFKLGFFIAVIIVVVLGFASWTGSKTYILPSAQFEGTQEVRNSATSLATTTNFSFTVNNDGTLYWFEDNE